MSIRNPIPAIFRVVMVGVWAATLILLENKRGLRRSRENKIVRDVRNLSVAALAGSVMQIAELPVAFHLAGAAEQRRWGILRAVRLPRSLQIVAGVLLLDYTLYWWHFFTHRVPFLWRFHQVHHVDRDMDATTGLRFHFGEIAISLLFRAAQIRIVGPSPFTVAAWQIFLFLCVLFHHSNVRLALNFERRLAHFVVTPRLHGIHHSSRPDEVNSNWSSGLTVWDWLHSTLRTDVPQDSITLGVPGFEDDASVRLKRILSLPFENPAPVPPYSGRPVRQPVDQLA
jgi:sterol desaturase/sphingolipid hydroxylase (fatty acid hydroxylase superfamily)